MPTMYKSDSVLQANTSDSSGPGLIQFKLKNNVVLAYPVIFVNFNLQKSEKVQITETFGENIHLYAFGKSSDVLQMSGMVLADYQLNSDLSMTNSLFVDKYNNTFRAFQASKNGEIINVVGPGGIVFDGMCVSITISATSQINVVMEFSMNLVGVNSIMAYSKSINKKTQSQSSQGSSNAIATQQTTSGSSELSGGTFNSLSKYADRAYNGTYNFAKTVFGVTSDYVKPVIGLFKF